MSWEQAVQRADEWAWKPFLKDAADPDDRPSGGKQPRPPGYWRFVRALYLYAETAPRRKGKPVVYLSARAGAKALHVALKSVGILLRWAVEDGYLATWRKYKPGSMRSARYWVKGWDFDDSVVDAVTERDGVQAVTERDAPSL